MRTELGRLLRDATFTTVASAIALGLGVYQVGNGVAYLIAEAVEDNTALRNPTLGFAVRGHIFYFQPLIEGLITLGIVLVVVLIARRRVGTSTESA
jgi:F0F1-type ATP synthase membrane subunit c/vacuolar-type H+-ATPase subunit K